MKKIIEIIHPSRIIFLAKLRFGNRMKYFFIALFAYIWWISNHYVVSAFLIA